MTVRILVGDVRDRLADLPDNSVQCVVTSPPYFGLRRYLPDGHPDAGHELGSEPTLAAYIATMVDVFRNVRRVLRPDGTCWLNIGDSYAGSWGNQGRKDERGTQRPINGGMLTPVHDGRYPSNGSNTGVIRDAGIKPKDLMMVPARLAIALQDDGWYIRSDIIWAKRAPMPESVTDRPTSAHEHIFLLTKAPRYFYDADAVREPHEEPERGANGQRVKLKDERPEPGVRNRTLNEIDRNGNQRSYHPMGRNQRNVWTLSPEPFPSAHFATFVTEIPRRCIKAGTSEKGACSACGSPWRRVVERTGETRREIGNRVGFNGYADANPGNPQGLNHAGHRGPILRESVTTGWEPSCSCDKKTDHPQAVRRPAVKAAGGIAPSIPEPYPVVPCTVLDPFGGAGTTGLVADELGRDCTLIELNRDYAEMARSRIYGAAPMFAAVEVA